ncbi:MAG: 5-formyltetrahydrofolate cyclo-ligase [Candidatus Saccharibacteria bacterium]
MDKRQELRQQMLNKRDVMDAAEASERSLRICHNLENLPALKKARVLMAYAPVRNEVNVTYYWERYWCEGLTVLLPRVQKDVLQAIEFKGWNQTEAGSFGIPEPEGKPYPLERIDAVIVPGLVFDNHGYRLGYGKGYYDSFLPRLRGDALKCGVAYDFQLVDNIMPTERDVGLDVLVTESEIIVLR